MTRKLLMLSAVAFALALVLSMDVTAKQQVVVLKTGRRIQGEVTKIETGYQVKTPGGTVVFAADQVAKIEDVVTQQDELEARLAKIDAKDPEALYQLARWCRARGCSRSAGPAEEGPGHQERPPPGEAPAGAGGEAACLRHPA